MNRLSLIALLALVTACGEKEDDDHDNPVGKTPHTVALDALDSQVVVLSGQSAAIELGALGGSGDRAFAVDTPPSQGQILGQLTGTRLTYDAPPNYVGADSFTFSVRDADGGEDSATVSIDVVADPTRDTDGDGLPDLDEQNDHGTSWVLADTDADGFSDGQELIELGFDPSSNPYRFNPLIADIPVLSVEFVGPPEIGLRFVESNGSSTTVSNSESNAVNTSTTTSSSNTNSTSVEQTWSENQSLTASDGGFSGTVSYGYSRKTSDTNAFTHSESQTQGNSQAWSSGVALSESTTRTTAGGYVKVPVSIGNAGHVAFTLENLSMALTRVTASEGTGTRLVPVGTLDYDSLQGASGFPSTTLAPGDVVGPLVFDKDDLAFGEAASLLQDAKGMLLDVALYEMSDASGQPLAHSATGILANCATLIIDYGPLGPDAERYMVATNATPQAPGVTVGDLMALADVPYQTGVAPWTTADTYTGLTEVRGVGTDVALLGNWQVVHTTDNGIDVIATRYDLVDADYDFAAIELAAGDVVHLVYVSDADGDDVWSREEALVGTDPSSDDTDGDGVIDSDELDGWQITVNGSDVPVSSDPLSVDSDGDGIEDGDEQLAGTNPGSADTDGDWITDPIDPDPANAAPTELISLTARPYNPGLNYPVDLEWEIDNTLDAANGVLDHGMMILAREELTPVGIEPEFAALSDEPRTGVAYQIDDTFPCEGIVDCWRVVAVADTTLATELVTPRHPQDHSVRYEAWVRINGVWNLSSRSAQASDSFDYAVLEATIESYVWEDCVDDVQLWTSPSVYWGVYDSICETQSTISAGRSGQALLVIAAGDRQTIQHYSYGTNVASVNQGLRTTVTTGLPRAEVSAPKIDGYCHDFEFAVTHDREELYDPGAVYRVTSCYSAATDSWSGLWDPLLYTESISVGAPHMWRQAGMNRLEVAATVRDLTPVVP